MTVRALRLVWFSAWLAFAVASLSAGAERVAEIYDPATDIWEVTGAIHDARFVHTATMLADGSVLIAGGTSGRQFFDTTEIYDPSSGRWTRAGRMSTDRYGHTATRLANGEVLVVGGYNGKNTARVDVFTRDAASAEGGRWRRAASLRRARDRHTATLLPSGEVLVAGGFSSGEALASVEIYDPVADRWHDGPKMRAPRAYASAAMLGDRQLLMAVGENEMGNLATCEVLDLMKGRWSVTGNCEFTHAYGQTMTRLTGNDFLVVGGEGRRDGPTTTDAAERFSSKKLVWQSAGKVRQPLQWHTATLLVDGRVLISGGQAGRVFGNVEIYDPATNSWSAAAPMVRPRTQHTATRLEDGRVLVVGGAAR